MTIRTVGTWCSILHYIITTGSIASNWLICRYGDVRHVRCANSHGAGLVPIPRVVILVAGISTVGIRCFVSVPSVWVVFIKPLSLLLSSSSHGTLFAPYSTIQCTTYCYLRPFCPFCYFPLSAPSLSSLSPFVTYRVIIRQVHSHCAVNIDIEYRKRMSEIKLVVSNAQISMLYTDSSVSIVTSLGMVGRGIPLRFPDLAGIFLYPAGPGRLWGYPASKPGDPRG
jgi:hypothetical protein